MYSLPSEVALSLRATPAWARQAAETEGSRHQKTLLRPARDAHYRDNPDKKEMHSMFSMPGRIDRDKLVNAANDGNEMKVRELLGASANPRRLWSPERERTTERRLRR